MIHNWNCFRWSLSISLISLHAALPTTILVAQDTPNSQAISAPDEALAAEDDAAAALKAPKEVDVDPLADDSQIAGRLTSILVATKWFEGASVEVDQGVVFLSGKTQKEDYKTWAGNLASNTQDVVAVVNRLVVVERSIWDMSPAWLELRKLNREAVQTLPLIGLAIAVFVLTWFAARWSTYLSKLVLSRRMGNRLLVNVISRSVAIPVFLIGLYLALRVSGLTQIAATVIGGTGLFGLVIGIAFRDIAENFLASVLISVQRPFALGDQIEVDGHEGLVQSVTARGTLLMTLDGNHVQIPNSTVYKSVIRNVTANPNIRSNFVVGIDYEDSVAIAQQTILDVLNGHQAVLRTPDPMVLVDELGSSTVNLRVYFWIDGHKHSLLKVRSSVIRLVKVAIEDAGLTMPDESREIIFPKGVPVRMLQTEEFTSSSPALVRSNPNRTSLPEDQQAVNQAEDGLGSEATAINEQARSSRSPEQGENLL